MSDKKRKIIDVKNVHEAAAKVAVAKGVAPSVKAFYENAINDASAAFYAECAHLAGVSVEDWLESASKGEF